MIIFLIKVYNFTIAEVSYYVISNDNNMPGDLI